MFAMFCRMPLKPEGNDFSTLADGCVTDKAYNLPVHIISPLPRCVG